MEGEPGADQQDEDNVEEEEEEEEEEEDEGVADENDSSKLFQQIFTTYQKISAQLHFTDGMEEVAREYTRLFDAAKAWRIQGDELGERVCALEEELTDMGFKYSECKQYAIGLREEVAVLKRELAETKKLADTAHTREQGAVEVVAGLRTELARVSKELGHKARIAVPDE
ncbi:Uncharacterized protein GBIM_03766 [Gryllus bimaculatus]|nr:Uncharacterized protein GBIM_03766 [Gryllus bimaculatus]